MGEKFECLIEILILDKSINDQRWLDCVESPQDVLKDLGKQFDIAKLQA